VLDVKAIVEVALVPGLIAAGALAVSAKADAVTVTLAVPVPPEYVPSPPYVTVNVSVPALRLFVGMANVKLPATRVCAAEVYPPPESVTVPVGTGPAPVTFAVTFRVWPASMLPDAGVTVTVDGMRMACVTITVVVPLAAA
jgi:hypothetical protein